MSNHKPLSGRCLCGAVRYTAVGRLDRSYACHCTDCQIRSGSAFAIMLPVPEAGFTVAGETLAVPQMEAHGVAVTLHACPKCLTRLFTQNPRWKGLVVLRAGTLERSNEIIPSVHLWVRSRQPWIVLPDDRPRFDTQPATPEEWRALLQ